MFVGDLMMASTSPAGATAVLLACNVTTMHFRHRKIEICGHRDARRDIPADRVSKLAQLGGKSATLATLYVRL